MVMFVSHSGNTEECVAAAQLLLERGVAILVITGNNGNLREGRGGASWLYGSC